MTDVGLFLTLARRRNCGRGSPVHRYDSLHKVPVFHAQPSDQPSALSPQFQLSALTLKPAARRITFTPPSSALREQPSASSPQNTPQLPGLTATLRPQRSTPRSTLRPPPKLLIIPIILNRNVLESHFSRSEMCWTPDSLCTRRGPRSPSCYRSQYRTPKRPLESNSFPKNVWWYSRRYGTARTGQ